MNFARTVTILCLLLPSITLSQKFDLLIVGTININVLTLECRNEQTGTSEPNAFFWLNGTSLFDVMPRVEINRQPGSSNIAFSITRDLEGMYTCGTQSNPNNQRESDPKYFPAFPVYQDLMGVPTLFPVASGTKARLSCAIQPGKLIGFYTVEWSDVNTGMTISLRGGHTSGNDNSNSGHYSIDRGDLSLIISDVSPADAGDYVCVLGVEGGNRADGEMVYEQTRSVNLSLVVFDLPRIPQPPTPQVVTLQNNDVLATNEDSVIFTCTATASEQFASSLEIFWWHGDVRDVQTIGSGRYSTEVIGRNTSNGVTSITTEMTIRSTGVIDNGIVRCEARIPPSEASGSVPATMFANTTLAILGGFSGMTVSVTQEGNIFFDIKLHDVIPIDVNLYIEYTPLNNPTSTIPIITKDGFINTENIIYLERAPPQAILDTEFTLQVALITQNLEMGPKSDKSRVLDTRSRPLSTEQLYEIIIIVSVIGGFVFLLLFILLIVIACLVKIHLKRKGDMHTAGNLALRVLPTEVEHNPGANPSDLLADVVHKIYKRIHQIDHGGAESAIRQLEPPEELSEEDITKAIESIKKIVNTGLAHPQLKPRVFKLFQEDIFYCTMTSTVKQDHLFLITAFKRAYCVLYEEVVDVDLSEEDLDNVVEFLEETLEGLLTIKHKFQLKEDLLIRLQNL